MHLAESQVYVFKQNHTCMHLTESHMYALMDHTYAFNRITPVCIKGSQVCIIT